MPSPGTATDRDGLFWNQKDKVKSHVLAKQPTTHLPQGHGTGLVLSDEKDIERGPLNNYESFNLRDYLALSNEENKAAGIQPKHIGVTWEDLQVVVTGSKDHKVRSFSWVSNRSSYFSNRHTSRPLIASSPVCSWVTY